MAKKIIMSLIFACVGVSTEVVFTAFYELISAVSKGTHAGDYSLMGKSYVWMLFIYASIPFFIRAIFPDVHKPHLIIKAFVGVILIYIVEYFSGWVLELFTGRCPWKYEEGWHIHGYIRLDFAPAWFVFALMILLIYKVLHERIVER